MVRVLVLTGVHVLPETPRFCVSLTGRPSGSVTEQTGTAEFSGGVIPGAGALRYGERSSVLTLRDKQQALSLTEVKCLF